MSAHVALSLVAICGSPSASSAACNGTGQIAELARGLKYDPLLIYEFVHNTIDYVPYFGGLKGAELTYLDGSGNDFDQATLMVELLRESWACTGTVGSTAELDYNEVRIPNDKLANWLGVDNNPEVLAKTVSFAGFPPLKRDSSGQFSVIRRFWVKAATNGAVYYFDPAYKEYSGKSGINFADATAYNRQLFLNAASEGASIATDWVSNINENGIRRKLTEYSSNLISYLRQNYPNATVDDIISKRRIIPIKGAAYPAPYSTPFTVVMPFNWSPEKISALATTLTISYQNNVLTYKMPEIAGKRITVINSDDGKKKHFDVYIEGNSVASGEITPTDSSNKYPMTIIVDHPFYVSDEGDQTEEYLLESDSIYSIVSDFGGTSNKLMNKRYRILTDATSKGVAETSELVRGETLNMIGLSWMKMSMMANRLALSINDGIGFNYHNVGVVAQGPSGYYVDLKTFSRRYLSAHTGAVDYAQYDVRTLESAFEHAVLEHLSRANAIAISTVKIIELANYNNNKIYILNKDNWSSISPKLQYYSDQFMANIQKELFDKGAIIILPETGRITLKNWTGYGYISRCLGAKIYDLGMIIDGGYNGGYSCDNSVVDSSFAQCSFGGMESVKVDSTITGDMNGMKVGDPIDIATGAYLYDHSDLSVGASTPLALAFARSYSSSRNRDDGVLSYGWSHNYDISLRELSDAEPGLGGRLPVEAAAFITELYISLDLMKNQNDLFGWVVMSLSHMWATDQLLNNAVTVDMGGKLLEFIKLPDGTYSSPEGITTTLVKNADNTYSLIDRFDRRIDFGVKQKVSQILDADGNKLSFSYDATDRLATVTDAFNRQLSLVYDQNKRLSSVTDKAGNRTVHYYYDADGNLHDYVDPNNNGWVYGYDGDHQMTSITDPLNTKLVINEYDSLGRVKTQTNPRIDADGNRYTVTDNFYFSGYRNTEEYKLGHYNHYYFDRKGRIAAIEDALGNVTSKEYDGQNHVVSVTDPRLNNTQFSYYDDGNIKYVLNAKGKRTDYLYDDSYHLTDVIDPLYHGTHFEYYPKHHLKSSQFGTLYDTDFNKITSGLFSTGATYYQNGQLNTHTDGRTVTTTYTYDAYGNPQDATVGNRPKLTTNYKNIGWLNSLTDQEKVSTVFNEYDNMGRPKLITDPLQKTTQFHYDAAGNMDYKIDRKQNKTEYTYTPLGKLDTITYPDAQPDTSSVSFDYDENERLEAMHDSIGTTQYEYYANNSIKKVTDANGFAVGYEYDEAGNLTKLTYPGDKTVSYTYDILNRLETVTIDWTSPKQTAQYYYDDAGRLDHLTNFNGTITTYGYDNANRLTLLEHKNPAIPTIPIARYEFTELDGNGNRKTMNATEPIEPESLPGATSYAYNAQKNRLTAAGGAIVTYDDEGQMRRAGNAFFTFNYAHQLEIVDSTTTDEYRYDGKGNRLKAIRAGVVTKYIYDAAGNLLAEADVNNTITRYYIQGLGLMAMVAPSGNTVYTYHFNPVGSTVAITDPSRAIVNKYAYAPFGGILGQSETIPQPFKFVGQFGVMAEPNGLYYMRARYYDPSLGRFISEDPLSFGGGDVNLMAYAGNNPVNRIDPWGMQCESIEMDNAFVILATEGPMSPEFTKDRDVAPVVDLLMNNWLSEQTEMLPPEATTGSWAGDFLLNSYQCLRDMWNKYYHKEESKNESN